MSMGPKGRNGRWVCRNPLGVGIFRRSRSLGAVAVAVALLTVAPAAAHAAKPSAAPCSTAWPTFQHDANRTGAASSCAGSAAINAGNASTLAPRWFAPLSSSVTASPAVVGNRVYIGDNGGVFHALNAADGSTVWE